MGKHLVKDPIKLDKGLEIMAVRHPEARKKLRHQEAKSNLLGVRVEVVTKMKENQDQGRTVNPVAKAPRPQVNQVPSQVRHHALANKKKVEHLAVEIKKNPKLLEAEETMAEGLPQKRNLGPH